ncbi:unnamed protein product [Cladocopium goreaui]|uniref:Glucose-6-phosphate 1-epimerase n=1 Tax=Cladocopium goreaui TaxID=2562237 RepID=A0A9P1G1R7_9DINO|nr:unnamed protein product [Cladocopium goreaui]
MGATGVPTDSTSVLIRGTKQHGRRPTMCDSTSMRLETATQERSRVEKRSLKRAYMRSLHQGVAWYKGKQYVPAEFERMGCAHTSPPDLTKALSTHLQRDWQRCNHHHAAKRRLTVWQWNCGGISAARLDEVKAWLVLNHVTIAVLVETRLTYDAFWTDPHWHCLHTGTQVFAWHGQNITGPAHPDQFRFLQLLRQFSLVVLNSWSATLGPTYVHGQKASRIDHICVRQMYADGEARKVSYLWQSPFLEQTDVGHVPMMCTIAKYWIPAFERHKIQTVTMQQRRESRQAYVDQTPTWQRFTQQTQHAITQHLATATHDADSVMDHMHQTVMETFCTHFPKGQQQRSTPPWMTALPTILNKWEHRCAFYCEAIGTRHSHDSGHQGHCQTICLTKQGISKANTQLTIMMRKLTHDHSFLTRRTNHEALFLHQLPTPAQLLFGTAAGLLRTHQDQHAQLLTHDLARSIHWHHLPDLMTQLQHLQATATLETSLPLDLEAGTSFFQCAKCDFCTMDVSAFRRHCTTAHGHAMYRTHHVDPAAHADNGLPTCKHCSKAFTTWRGFRTHIERGCQALLIGPAPYGADTDPLRAHLGTLRPMNSQAADAAARGLRLITADELHNLKQQDFGPRLLHLIAERNWEQLATDQAACRYLSSRCVICSFQFSRCQELHQHFRLQHPELWEHAPQKAIQLTNIYSDEPPCGCCGALFRTHSCPTWSQIAVLLVNGAGLDAVDPTPLTEERHRCELCLIWFCTTAALVQHLQASHGLQGLSFVESRDALDNTTACAHCGLLFQSMSGLKSHIVQGRCEHFNPNASAETMEIDALWRQACLEGKLMEVLAPPHNRMRLTIVCQACGKGCKRAADLSLHLQTSHARLWRQSERLTMILVDALYQQRCYCNPQVGTKRGSHVCLPFRQIAMSYHRMGTEIFAPTVITDTTLKDVLSDKLPREIKYRLEQALVHRSFANVWQDPAILQMLRGQCIFCGDFHATSDLALHLREAFQHLAPLFQVKDKDLTLQANPRKAKSRRKEEPNSQDSKEDVDMPNVSTAPTMQLLRTLTQLVVRHDQELQDLRKMDQFILFLNPEPTGALHILLQESAQWKKSMEEGSTSLKMPLRQHLMKALLNAMMTRAGQIVESKDTEGLFTTSLQKGVILADRSFPFHRWDPATKQLTIDKKQPVSAAKMKQHLEELLEMLTDPAMVIRFHALSQSKDQTSKAVPWRLQINMRPGQGAEGAEGHTSQTRALSPALVAEMTKNLSIMCMANDRNWCYGNSTAYSFLWTLLCLNCHETSLWGWQSSALIDFIQHHSTPVVLKNIDWFKQILLDWGISQTQQDSAECAQHLLNWLQPQAFDMRWERRLDTEHGLHVFDHSTSHTPILLPFARGHHVCGTCKLTDLIVTWMQEQSMCTALVTAPPCICLTIDRFHQTGCGTIERNVSAIDLEAEVEIPVFTTGLECDMLGYIVVAAIAHLGQDRSGHCRALLKIQPGVTTAAQPIAWLLTDDEQKPAPVWQIPTWFQTHATVVWAVRTDCLRLPVYQPESGTSSEPSNTKDASHVDPVTTPETALIHLLQAQPGVGTEE